MTTTHTSGFGAASAVSAKDSSHAAIRGGHLSTKAWAGVGGQWGAIAGAAFTGLAVAVVMATLGAALGFSASAAAADHASINTVTADGVRDVALGFSIGAGVWLLISAVVVGIAGGLALAKMSHQDRPYAPGTLGVATWALGVCIAVFLAASGASGLATGLGVGAAGAAAAAPLATRSSEVGAASSSDVRGVEARDATSRDSVRGAEAALGANAPPLTPEQRQAAIVAAKAAATAAATAAWFALVAQLLGLGATLWAAGRRKFQADLVTVVQHA